jgi:hypothetical protein
MLAEPRRFAVQRSRCARTPPHEALSLSLSLSLLLLLLLLARRASRERSPGRAVGEEELEEEQLRGEEADGGGGGADPALGGQSGREVGHARKDRRVADNEQGVSTDLVCVRLAAHVLKLVQEDFDEVAQACPEADGQDVVVDGVRLADVQRQDRDHHHFREEEEHL